MAEPPPGTLVEPRRFRPKLHWELIVCGVSGHELVGTDAANLHPEDSLVARELGGVRFHRCLRCDSWLPLPPPEPATRDALPSRDEIELPLRGRPLRDKVVLRLIAVDRAFHFVVLGALAILAFVFASHRDSLKGSLGRAIIDLQGGTVAGAGHAKTGLLGDLDKLFTLDSSKIRLFGATMAVYALVEGIEAVGLWYARRWAEYLTFVVTASLLPFEVYELSHRVTVFKVLAFIINVAVVVYLLRAKRLFGVRGGVAADEAERERDVGWGALERATPTLR
ncbi:MAG: hypothetical protein JWM71_2603 [Solirubrobacteraceae bacterium]|nr:hypothetical protein [Solirubrobacteraceae bacterium]